MKQTDPKSPGTPASVPAYCQTQPAPVARAGEGLRVPLRSEALLQGQKYVTIEHQGVIYRLQVTRLGKLILTK